MNGRVFRLGIVSFAHMHAYSYARVAKELEARGRVVLEAIFDDNEGRLKRAVELYKPRRAYSDFDKLLEEVEVDVAIVASENAKHAKYAVPLLDRGVHVLVEKPIATRLEDAWLMIKTAESRGVKLQVAFVMRYHDASHYVLSRVRELGRIYSITATNHGKCPFDWFVDPELAGGGAIMDHVVHVADLIRWYTGDEFEEVVAFVGRNIYPELKVEDNAILIGRLKSGATFSIDCSWSRPANWPTWGDVYMHIVGERGAIVLNAFNQNISLADETGFKWVYYGPDADRNMIEDFLRVVERDETPRASGLDGLKALEVVIAAYKSIREKRPVKISELYS
jgi:predicted dehydrogenase